MAHNFKQWTVDDVSKWLESLHLHSLIPMFERFNITGADLPQLDDVYLRESLRITKPGEITVLKGAIYNLVDQASQPPPAPRLASKVPNRKVSNAPVKPVERDRSGSGSFDKQKTYPQMAKKTTNFGPTTMPRNFTVSGGEDLQAMTATREPRLKKGASAPEVLDDKCRYSGWIRKQGGGYKNWRRRYLVLRLGCLYYFANETAKEAKGCFTLAGYQTEICDDPEILKKQKWTLKVEPLNGSLRTYYMSVGAKRELYAWKQAIDEEIAACARRPRGDDRVPSGPTSNNYVGIGEMGDSGDLGEVVGDGSSDEEGEDEEPIYDQPDEADDEFNEDGECPIYDRPDDDEEDDPYSEISEDVLVGVHHTSPTSTHPLHPSPLPKGKGGAPTVPMRSLVSLGFDQKQALPSMRGREEGDEDTYLPIIGSGPSDSTPLTADRPKLISPPHNPVSTISERPEFDRDYEDDAALDGEDFTGEEIDDPYYIMVRKPEELMPPSCLFDNLDRGEADRLLRAKGLNGTYLIRAGSHAGVEKVLSVWHNDRCRHYKLFKDESSQYSLTQGRTFGTIPLLLQNYSQGDHLPRSDFHLSEPYYPS